MLVRDRMSAPAITLTTDADYKLALGMMQQHGMHHVPVLAPDGALAGIVAERDLLLAATRYLQSGVEVGEVMHCTVVTVTPETPLAQAATLMSRHKIGGLPVVNAERRVVGVITETDMLAAFADLLMQAENRARRTPSRPAGVNRTRRAKRLSD